MTADRPDLEHPDLDRAAIEARIRELGPWFHNMDLRGVPTAPDHFLGDFPRVKWNSFRRSIPDDLSGRSVLDIGCNGGFYTVEMKRRGAARVVGIDVDDDYLAQARFAASVEGLDIEFRQMSVYDVGALGETFDLVIFCGVLYHLRHPLLALELIRTHVSGGTLVFQSMQRGTETVFQPKPDYVFQEEEPFNEPGWPVMHFIEHSYSNDPTNWWAPNRACSAAMLRAAGFRIVSHPEREIFICENAPGAAPEPVYPARRPRRNDDA